MSNNTTMLQVKEAKAAKNAVRKDTVQREYCDINDFIECYDSFVQLIHPWANRKMISYLSTPKFKEKVKCYPFLAVVSYGDGSLTRLSVIGTKEDGVLKISIERKPL